ncbi:MAG: trigger factor [Parcubacteria group bacterium]|nr:MAG: trigger factor [Parcubacteria group bacterium]
MNISKKDLEKSQVEINIEVNLDEMQPFLDKAALRLAQKTKISGFRPGKAPYALVQAQVGEMAIYEEALESIINHAYYEAIKKEDVQSVGQPEIKVEKFAPGNPLIFKAIVTLLPSLKLADWKSLRVAKKPVELKDEDTNKTLSRLQEMQAKENIVEREAKKGDKIVVDFEVYIDKVIIEGGKNYKYPVILGQGNMIPGFEEKLYGQKAGAELDFELKFPDKYFQKNVAGRLANFKVKIIGVYDRQLPEINDDFAKKIGLDTLAKLKEQLQNNIRQDKEYKEKQRQETEAIRAIIEKSIFGDIAPTLLENEVHKMIHELEHSLGEQGLDLPTYLKSLNKTHDDLHRDFEPQATERIKAAIILRQLARDENIQTSAEEIEADLQKQREQYRGNEQALQNIDHPEYKKQLGHILNNHKVIQFICDTIVK